MGTFTEMYVRGEIVGTVISIVAVLIIGAVMWGVYANRSCPTGDDDCEKTRTTRMTTGMVFTAITAPVVAVLIAMVVAYAVIAYQERRAAEDAMYTVL